MRGLIGSYDDAAIKKTQSLANKASERTEREARQWFSDRTRHRDANEADKFERKCPSEHGELKKNIFPKRYARSQLFFGRDRGRGGGGFVSME